MEGGKDGWRDSREREREHRKIKETLREEKEGVEEIRRSAISLFCPQAPDMSSTLPRRCCLSVGCKDEMSGVTFLCGPVCTYPV